MNILIVGGGRSGSYVAERLKNNNKITVIEQNPEQIAILAKQNQDIKIIKGDGCEPNILEKANIMQMDIMVALTGDDEDNLVISFLSKFQNRVPLVFSRINNPKNEWLFNNTWGVDIALSSSILLANMIQEEIGLGELVTLLKLQKENLVIEEIMVSEASKIAGIQLKQIKFPENTRVILILSGTKYIIPEGNTQLNPGDKLILIAPPEKLDELSEILT
ncbi:MAG: NAD-binding protein [Actinobacteria bacterium]|nr:NAD-binding protein [Actinomycetota bacterium]MCL5072084.1 NAD-binding protein [Actinomycetota bacterium]